MAWTDAAVLQESIQAWTHWGITDVNRQVTLDSAKPLINSVAQAPTHQARSPAPGASSGCPGDLGTAVRAGDTSLTD